MGKQRIPQGQRPGRRVPVHRVPAGPAASVVAEAPSEAIMEAEPAMNQDSAEQNAPQAETLDAAPAATETAAVEAAPEEPAADTRTEAAEEVSEPDNASEPEAAAPEEPTAAAAEEFVASDEERADAPAPEAALSDPLLPVAALAAASPAAAISAEVRSERPAEARTAFRFAFTPVRIDVEGISVVLANYVHNEGVAAFSHMRALSTARSPAEMIRLNVTEMQRAADASLTCWTDIARRAARSVPLH